MGVFKIILTVLEVIASIGLIVVVLLQSGKEAGLSGALAGNNDSYMNRIHTKRATVFEEDNIAYLTQRTITFIESM